MEFTQREQYSALRSIPAAVNTLFFLRSLLGYLYQYDGFCIQNQQTDLIPLYLQYIIYIYILYQNSILEMKTFEPYSYAYSLFVQRQHLSDVSGIREQNFFVVQAHGNQ